jgi:putative tricarboxylic transport membrane protein
MRGTLALLIAAVGGLAAIGAHAQSAWKPEKTIEIAVGSSAGTGTDRTARLIESIWRERKVVNVPIIVTNKPGGGGSVAYSYMTQRAGDPHHLLVTSYNLVAGHIVGRSPVTYTDFTLISLLISEYIVYSVRAESPIKSVADLVSALKKDPQSIPLGVSSAVAGANHIAVGLLAKAAGIDPKQLKVVVFPGTGPAIAALLGGHTGLFVNSASATASHFLSGKARPLAVAAPQRLPGAYASVPTLKELGIPVVADNWRLVIAPKGLTPAQTAYWDNTFKTLAASEEWNKELATNHMANTYRTSAETTRYVGEQYKEIKELLTELGLAKAPAAPR